MSTTNGTRPSINDMFVALKNVMGSDSDSIPVINGHVMAKTGLHFAALLASDLPEDDKFEVMKEIIVAYQGEKAGKGKAKAALAYAEKPTDDQANRLAKVKPAKVAKVEPVVEVEEEELEEVTDGVFHPKEEEPMVKPEPEPPKPKGTTQGLAKKTVAAVADPINDKLREALLELIGTAPAVPDIAAIVKGELDSIRAQIVAEVKAEILESLTKVLS